jgi:hypothetical protein
MACGKCGYSSAAGARFCAQCGSALTIAKRPNLLAKAVAASHSKMWRKVVVYVVGTGQNALLHIAERLALDHDGHFVIATGHEEVQDILRELDNRRIVPSAVCLLGTADSLPHAEFEDATHHDTVVLTDNDYGMLRSPTIEERYNGLCLPSVAVCRVPTEDAEVVERVLTVRRSLASDWKNGLAVTAAVWEGASAKVLSNIAPRAGVELGCSPPNDAARVGDKMSSQPGRVYFNVHGSSQTVDWSGEGGGRYVTVLRPSDVVPTANGIMMSEACYGARHDSLDGDTIASTFFKGGGGAFVGSTIIAWGPRVAPIGQADLIISEGYKALDAGFSLPVALLRAKEAIVKGDGLPLSPQNLNTISSFVAYGGPLAAVHGVREPRRERVSFDGGSGGGPLGAARARLAERARRGGWQPVSEQRIEIEQLSEHFRRSDKLIERVKKTLNQGQIGDMRVMKYSKRVGHEVALMVTEKASTRKHLFVLDPIGGVKQHLCTK